MITLNELPFKYQQPEAQGEVKNIYFHFLFYWKKIKRE